MCNPNLEPPCGGQDVDLATQLNITQTHLADDIALVSANAQVFISSIAPVIHRVSKNCAQLFLPYLCQISTDLIADNKIADADELKTRLIDEWAQFDQSIVDAAISVVV